MSGVGAGPRRVLPRFRRARHLDRRAAPKSKSLSFKDEVDAWVRRGRPAASGAASDRLLVSAVMRLEDQ